MKHLPLKRALQLMIVCLMLCSFSWSQEQPEKLAANAANVTGGGAPTVADARIRPSSSAVRNGGYIIGPDDVLMVDVWKEAELTRSVTVRYDGKISLPLIGEVQAESRTPKQLEDDISAKLAPFIKDSTVSVNVQESRSRHFKVLGNVAHPGSYVLTQTSTTVLDAIALAGGFRDFAKQKSIYVLRQKQDGTQVKLPFNYKEVIQGKNSTQNVFLEPSDTVVVP